MKPIGRGDRVRVVMLHGGYFPGQGSPAFEATYLSGPSGPGDVFVLEMDDGRELNLNGNSSVFVGMHLADGGSP